MKKVLNLMAVACIAILLSNCANTKNVPYFQNLDEVSLAASKGLYESKIMPKDELAIYVSTADPAASRPFNMYINNNGYSGGGSATTSLVASTSFSGNSTLVSFLVDNDGNINYPVFGKMHVAGMTKPELQDHLQKLLTEYFRDNDEKPIVTVRTINYRVTIMGEVSSPKVITTTCEKLSILEALSQAGDLTIYGKRDNILIIREMENGEKITHRMNLNDANIINDPYYYLQQNDIVYVTPSKIKARNSDIGNSTTMIFTVLSSLLSFASLGLTIYNVTKK